MSIGVVIGRFQVPELHQGYLRVIDAVRALHGDVVFFVQTLPTRTVNDPLTFEMRERMLRRWLPLCSVIKVGRARNT